VSRVAEVATKPDSKSPAFPGPAWIVSFALVVVTLRAPEVGSVCPISRQLVLKWAAYGSSEEPVIKRLPVERGEGLLEIPGLFSSSTPLFQRRHRTPRVRVN